MTTYYKVIDNQITAYSATVGSEIAIENGSVVFGTSAQDSDFAQYGYYPVIETIPQYDSELQKLDGYTDTFNADNNTIERVYVVVNLTQQEIDDRLQVKRAGMVLTPAQARLKLANLNMLSTVNTAISQLAEDNAMRIKWEYATQIERLDTDLVNFCVNTLGLDDISIDNLFE